MAFSVALRKESVDRNSTALTTYSWRSVVALRKESVDRNSTGTPAISPPPVALRKESVDRNIEDDDERETLPASLSARRAWIEIGGFLSLSVIEYGSLSARRAWIEISVDRVQHRNWPGRSPQGERG